MSHIRFPDHVMFCNSTGNQAINIIPALQLGVKNAVIISTNHAEKSGLTQRLVDLMNKRKISVSTEKIDSNEEKNIKTLTEKLTGLSRQYDKVIWNISGGQKIPTVALHDAFQKRIEAGFSDDIILYVEGNDPAIWYYGKDFRTEKIKSNVALRLDELLMLAASKIYKGTELYPSPSEDTKKNLEVGSNALEFYMSNDLFREAFFSLMSPTKEMPRSKKELEYLIKDVLNNIKPNVGDLTLKKSGYENFEKAIAYAVQQISNSKTVQEAKDGINKLKIIEKPKEIYDDYWNSIKKACIDRVIERISENRQQLISQKINDSNKNKLISQIKDIGGEVEASREEILYKDDVRKFSSIGGNANLFEWMVSASVVNSVSKYPEIQDCISEVYCNVKTQESSAEDAKHDSEIDVLIATKFGTLIVLEAKTYDFSGDTAKSKESIAYKKNGPFARAIIIGPLIRTIIKEKGNGIIEAPQYIDGKTKDQKLTAKQHGIMYCYLDEIESMLRNQLMLKKE